MLPLNSPKNYNVNIKQLDMSNAKGKESDPRQNLKNYCTKSFFFKKIIIKKFPLVVHFNSCPT